MEEIKTEEVTLADQPKKANPAIVIVLVIALVGIGFFLYNNKPKVENNVSATTNPTVETPANLKEFVVNGGNFKFDLAEIKVKVGDTVKVTFTNNEGMHDFVLDEFSAKTNALKVNESETVTFIADKAGTFEYYCSVGQHRKMGMVGKLVVE